MKLNLGCGMNKLKGFVNVDKEPSCKPDRLCDFVHGNLPYKAGTVEEVVLFHTIEHIQKRFHKQILGEVFRVLKPGGTFLVSYPDFEKCAMNWISNHKGQRDFWEKTIYGRQLFPADFHVCAMHTPSFKLMLLESGFETVKTSNEKHNDFNAIVRAVKSTAFVNYETLCEEDMNRTTIVHEKPLRRKASAN